MKALILVGGYGTRLRPLTLSVPKPIVDFCNKPMILHQIEALVKVGVDEVVLAVNYRPEEMTVFLDKKQKELGITITISQEDEPLDTAGPIKLAEKYLNDGDPFFVFNSDVTCSYPLKQMIAHLKETGAEGLLLATPVEDPSKYGVIIYDDRGKIKEVHEKPSKFISRYINAGIYLLRPSVFDRIELRPTSIETEVFPAMVSEGVLYVIELNGFWADIGQPKDYLVGQTLLLESYCKNESDQLTTGDGIQGNVMIHPSAKIGADCLIGPDVVIGEGCVVGDGVRLQRCTILSGAKIEKHVCISESIIGWRSKIGNWVRIDSSVFGEDVKVKNELHVASSIILPHKTVKKSLTAGSIVL